VPGFLLHSGRPAWRFGTPDGKSFARAAAVCRLPDQGIGQPPATHRKEPIMNTIRLSSLVAGLAVAASLAACADMTPREHSTAVGAGVGAAAGAVLTGTPQGAAAGGVVGGVIGNQIKR
jgi:osmotically inducible lipoprotein OsmB